jgi:hypothetical protein
MESNKIENTSEKHFFQISKKGFYIDNTWENLQNTQFPEKRTTS